MTAWFRSAACAAAAAIVLCPATPRAGAFQSKDVVETAIAAGSFKTLVSAIQAAGWSR